MTAVAMLWTVAPLYAQTEAAGARNAVYVELLGNGGVYSLNFDRRVGQEAALRIGVGAWSADDLFLGNEASSSLVTLPVTASWLPGTANGRPELGGGMLLGRRTRDEPFDGGSTSSTFASLTAILGYRYQPASGGWMFRVAFTPFWGFGGEDEAYPDRGFTPSAGVSGGYTF
ncbi:MAG TPA: hypothetical protein VFS20_33490 [Longimicrobium sp.]|nr:hypothetical protein [Longimicrobium sp.]